MLIELFESLCIALILEAIVFSFICLYLIIKKKKIKFYLISFFLLILFLPLTLVAVYQLYVYGRYNYHLTSDDGIDLSRILANKGRMPLFITGSKNIEIYHSMPAWMVRCNVDESKWRNFIGIRFEKTNLKLIDVPRGEDQDIKLINKINLNGFDWDEKYETQVGDNGSRLIIYRNSKNGDVCIYANRW